LFHENRNCYNGKASISNDIDFSSALKENGNIERGQIAVKKSTFAIFSLIIIALLGISGCQPGANDEAQQELDELQSKVQNLQNEVEYLKQELNELHKSPLLTNDEQIKTVVYFGLVTEQEILTVPTLHSLQQKENIYRQTVEILIEGPEEESPLSPIVPDDTEIHSIEISEGRATLDFSNHVSEFATGSAGETMVISGIVNTLTEFPEIDEVMILVDGQEGVSLGGHFILDEPLKRSKEIIP